MYIVRSLQVKLNPVFVVRYFLGGAFIVATLFPHVSFRLNDMDSQPWSIFFAILFLLCNLRVKLPVVLLPLLFVIPVVTIFALWDGYINFSAVRAVVSYSSLALVVVVSFIYMSCYGVPFGIIYFANMAYLAAGLAQAVFGNDIFSFALLSRTTEGRGVTGLSVEPTYYALILFFISWIYLVAADYKPRGMKLFLVMANTVAILFLAKSSMVFIFIFIFFFAMIFKSANFAVFVRRSVLIALLGSLIVGGVLLMLEGSRLDSFIGKLLSDGVLGVIHEDASINDRVSSVVFPFHGLIYNSLLPGGFHSYSSTSDVVREAYNNFFWYGGGGNTIMSYWGAMVYELGFFGILLMIYLLSLLAFKGRIFEAILLFLFLFSAIPISFPLISFFFALCFYLDKQKIIFQLDSAHPNSSKCGD